MRDYMKSQFGYFPVSSELISEKNLNSIIDSYASLMGKGGGHILSDKDSKEIPFFYFVISS